MSDLPKSLVPRLPRTGRRIPVRTAWAGTLAAVTAGSLLLGTVPGAPGRPAEAAGPPPEHRAGAGPAARAAEPVVEAAALTGADAGFSGVAMAQVLAVLDRAERLTGTGGTEHDAAVAQAARSLDDLVAAYLGVRRQAYPVTHPAAYPVPVTFGRLLAAAVRLSYLLDAAERAAAVDDHVARLEASAPADGPEAPTARTDGGAGRERRTNEGLPGLVTAYDSTTGYANGRIPSVVLCTLGFAPGQLLRCDAAEHLEALNAAFEREFGRPIPITDSYRSYAEQVAVAHSKPHLAAVPGTSNHGWGLAVDLGAPISGGRSAEYRWLRAHAPEHGWDNPAWARPGGSKPEPWHFEFVAAGPVGDRGVFGRGAVVDDATDRTAAGATSTGRAADGAARPDVSQPSRPDAPAGGTGKDTGKDSGKGSDGKPGKGETKPAPEPTTKPKPTPKPTPKPAPSPSPSEPEPEPSPSEPGSTPAPTPSEPAPSEPPTPEPTPEPTAPAEPTPAEPTPSATPSGQSPTASPAASPSASAAPSATAEDD